MPFSPQLIELLAPEPSEARVLVLEHEHPLACSVQSLLSKQERARSRRYRDQQDRFAAATSWGMLRLGMALLSNRCPSDLVISRDEMGRPYVQGISREVADINISRRRGCCVMVLSRGGPCGVDIERVDHEMIHEELQRTMLSEHELAVSTDPAVSFYKRWSALEAVLKADGRGLSDGTGAAKRLESLDSTKELWACGQRNWEVHPIQAPTGFVACVAVPEGFRRCEQIGMDGLKGLADTRILCALKDLGQP